jgi:redox-sensitive bicupin YhaK (pirin superfamily)
MLAVRRAADRGHFDHGWLNAAHTFSFGHYHDPRHEQFRALRVMNEDRIAPGRGFPRHGHRDMEILTHVRSGSLEHRDSLGSGAILKAGQWQRMTAGSGILHSEGNPSPTEPVHLYQIWLFPEAEGLPPGYEQTETARIPAPGHWVRVAAPGGENALMTIHQDAVVLHGAAGPGHLLTLDLAPGRHAWIQVLDGSVTLPDGTTLETSDGAAVSDERHLSLTADSPAEVLVFDLA